MTALPAAAAPLPGQVPVTVEPASTPTQLYFHLIGLNDFPINTQAPDQAYAQTPTKGVTSITSSCLPAGSPVGFAGREEHTSYGYSSPSLVEYNFSDQGHPRVHPERGLSYDIQVDPSQPWVLTWYLETQTAPASAPGADPNQAPIVVPNVVVTATIRSGDAITTDGKGYNAGDVLAQGHSDPVTLAGPLSDQLDAGKAGYAGTNQSADGHWVTGFRIPLTLGAPTIPKKSGYNVRIDVSMDNPACNDPGGSGYLMPSLVRTHTSPQFRPGMSLNVLNPVNIPYVHPEPVGDEIVIHTEETSPWGSYDVEAGQVQMHLSGPGITQDPQHLARAAVSTIHIHGPDAHTKPYQVSYVWDYKADQAQDGTYTVTMDAWNLQHTAHAHAVATFQIGGPGSNGGGTHTSPAGAVPFLAAGLLAAALVVVRRSS